MQPMARSCKPPVQVHCLLETRKDYSAKENPSPNAEARADTAVNVLHGHATIRGRMDIVLLTHLSGSSRRFFVVHFS